VVTLKVTSCRTMNKNNVKISEKPRFFRQNNFFS
jgi:hypothetical protein